MKEVLSFLFTCYPWHYAACKRPVDSFEVAMWFYAWAMILMVIGGITGLVYWMI